VGEAVLHVEGELERGERARGLDAPVITSSPKPGPLTIVA
jgi:hypothetical protein